jgi:hypothetical protein
VLDGGNVGIGIANPTQKLYVVGDTRIEGNLTVNGTQTVINTDVITTEQLLVTNNGTGPALVVNQTGQQPVIDIQDDGVSVMKIVNNGNIGMGTTDPQAKLHVNGSAIVSSLNAPGGNYLTISNGAGSGSLTMRGNDITTSGGYVGIGTTNPQATLHVQGNIRTSGSLYMDNVPVSFVPGTTQSLLFLIIPSWLSNVRNTKALYDNETVIGHAQVQGFGLDNQWYTFGGGNQIAEQLQECFTYWLKNNRLLGHTHIITLMSKGTADTNGMRFYATRASNNDMWVYGAFGTTNTPHIISWEAARLWTWATNVTISKY